MPKRLLLPVLALMLFALPARSEEQILARLQAIPDADMFTGELAKYDVGGITLHTYASKEGYGYWTLLFETAWPAPALGPQAGFDVAEVLGFDCIGTVYHSYLQTEAGFLAGQPGAGPTPPNKNGLLDDMAAWQQFVDARRRAMARGINLEDYWTPTPARISVVRVR